MNNKPILIVGAGLSGLCTAIILKKNTISFRVFEKDDEPNIRDQGYRIHLDGKIVQILEDMLSREAFDMFLALSQPIGKRFTLWNQQLNLLASFKSAANHTAQTGRGISRFSLRQLLLSELDGAISYAKEFVRFEPEEGGIKIHFKDKSSANGCFLIGADGVTSRVTDEFKPAHKAADTGALYVIGKLPLSDRHHALFPPFPFERLGIAFGRNGINLFMSEQLITHKNADHPERFNYLNDPKDFSIWSIVCKQEKFTNNPDISTLSTSEIKNLSRRALTDFHPALRQMVDETDEDTLICSPIRSTKKTSTWKTNRLVTIIGDAAHAMTPLQGKGANKAIQDAYRLGNLLKDVDVGTDAFQQALADFEKQMQRSSRSAVRRSAFILKLAVSAGGIKWVFLNGLTLFGKLSRLFQAVR